jgi:hypothetical protein
LDVELGDRPLTLRRLTVQQTNHPIDSSLKVQADGSETVRKMIEVSEGTMRGCTFDGYPDCPFYEQLQ